MRVIKHQPWTPFFYTPCIVCKFERISCCAYVRSDKGKISIQMSTIFYWLHILLAAL